MKAPARRQIFVFTPDEKKAAGCILGALVLGLATQHYRATHPRPSPPPTAREQRAAKVATRTANAQARSARSQARRVTPTPVPDAADDD